LNKTSPIESTLKILYFNVLWVFGRTLNNNASLAFDSILFWE